MIATSDYKKKFKLSFADRLSNKLQEKRFISRRGAIINGKILAAGFGVSLTTIRHYLNGKSIPKNTTLQRISTWLDVDPIWLLYGNHVTCVSAGKINEVLFKKIFEHLFPFLHNTNITKAKYMRLIKGAFDIYCYLVEMNKDKYQDTTLAVMINLLNNNQNSH